MGKFIIKFNYPGTYFAFVGNGGSYIHQGEKYVVLVEDYVQAKKYKTCGTAKAAVNKFTKTCVNSSFDYEIIEVEDDEQ